MNSGISQVSCLFFFFLVVRLLVTTQSLNSAFCRTRKHSTWRTCDAGLSSVSPQVSENSSLLESSAKQLIELCQRRIHKPLARNKTGWHRVMVNLNEFHEDLSKRLSLGQQGKVAGSAETVHREGFPYTHRAR